MNGVTQRGIVVEGCCSEGRSRAPKDRVVAIAEGPAIQSLAPACISFLGLLGPPLAVCVEC